MTYQGLDKTAKTILFLILCSCLVPNEFRVSLIGDDFRKPIFLTSPEGNSDTLFVDHNTSKIAELYYRFENEEVAHYRIVRKFSDMIANIGGLQRL